MIIAGIDEAGYGPKLGPMVVAGTAFRCPEVSDLWENFSPLAARCRDRKRTTRFLVDDSKTVYRRSNGPDLLEKTVSAFLSVYRTRDRNRLFSSLDERFPPPEPFYGNGWSGIPETGDASALSELVALCRSRDISLPALSLEVCFAEEFNRKIRTGMNKADLLFEKTAAVLSRILACVREGEDAVVTLDRQGGRVYYLSLLRRAFPGRHAAAVLETPELSEYRLDRNVRLRFAVGADGTCFAAALSSMFAKYIRECYVKEFNDFWRKRIPGLKATAGYPADAKRFLRDIYSCMKTDRKSVV